MSGSSILYMIVFFTYLLLMRYGGDLIDLAARGRGQPKVSRLEAYAFVEQHPELRQLGDADALTVASVLRGELVQHDRRGRLFNILLNAGSVVAGFVLAKLFS